MRRKDSRGFTTFDTMECSYGTSIWVHESSAASRPHIWLSLKEDPRILTKPMLGEAGAHMSLPTARRLVRALNEAIAEHYQVRKNGKKA